MTTTMARPATLREIKRHVANDRPESLTVTIFVGGSDYTVTTGVTVFGEVTVGDILRICETAAQKYATFVLHS